MSRRSKVPVTPVVMAAVLAFAAWVYFDQYKGEEERERQKDQAAALLPFSNSNIVGIEIQRREGGTTTVLRKEPGTETVWKVEKPYADLADPTVVDTFLSTLSVEKSKETVVAAPDIAWAIYGLDKPMVEATIMAKTDSGERKRVIQIGSVLAYDGSVYVRLDQENKVVLMMSTVQAALQRDPRDFRDKRFFLAKEHPEMSEIQISRSGYPGLHFVAKEGTWAEAGAKPGAWPLDQGVVKSYVQTVTSLRGNDVWAEDKKDATVLRTRGLDRPALTVKLAPDAKSKTGDVKATYEVKIAALMKEQSVAAGVSSARPLVFSVYKAQVDALSKTGDDFRDLSFPFQFKIAEVQGVELERPKGAVSLPMLVRKDGKWLIDPMDAGFRGRELKPDVVDRLMTDLNGLKAKKVLPRLAPKPKASEKGALRVGIFAEKSRKLIEFIFVPQTGAGSDVVRVSSSLIPDRVFEIEKAQFDALSLDIVAPSASLPTTPAEAEKAIESVKPGVLPDKGKP